VFRQEDFGMDYAALERAIAGFAAMPALDEFGGAAGRATAALPLPLPRAMILTVSGKPFNGFLNAALGGFVMPGR
jgi:hypothetical protein